MTVRTVSRQSRSAVITAQEHDVFLTLVERLTRNDAGALVVLDPADRLLGIITERDLLRALARYNTAVFAHAARDIMTTKVTTCSPEETDVQALTRMAERQVRHLPVVEEGRVVGMISIGDMVRHRLAKLGHRMQESVGAGSESPRGSFSRHLGPRPGSIKS